MTIVGLFFFKIVSILKEVCGDGGGVAKGGALDALTGMEARIQNNSYSVVSTLHVHVHVHVHVCYCKYESVYIL